MLCRCDLLCSKITPFPESCTEVKAGGEKDIGVYLIANEKAIPFCEKSGMKKADDVMQYNHIEWTAFSVQ